jgi:C1A family cysteine protease
MKLQISGCLILAMIVISLAQSTDEETLRNYQGDATQEIFSLFQKVYNKNYTSDRETNQRYEIFQFNIEKINDVNSQNLNYKFGITEYADLTAEEFAQGFLVASEQKKKFLTGSVRLLQDKGVTQDTRPFRRLQLFSPVDWRNNLQPPRDQGRCDSSWAFVTATVVEGAVNKKYSTNDYLSVQELIDCERRNKGCRAGDVNYSLDYVQQNGLSLEAEYPYKSKQTKCKSNPEDTKHKISSYFYCSNYDPNSACSESIAYDILSNGPSIGGIDGSELQLYQSGIFDGNCTSDNHMVVTVGFGSENGQDFWIVRNSWGPKWGENGYIRVARNDANNYSCFVANESWTVIAQ